MDKITLTDLQYKKIDSASANAPHTVCNQCGHSKPIHGGYMADVHFADDGHFSFFLCSIECMVKFHSIDQRELVDSWITDQVNTAKRLHQKIS